MIENLGVRYDFFFFFFVAACLFPPDRGLVGSIEYYFTGTSRCSYRMSNHTGRISEPFISRVQIGRSNQAAFFVAVSGRYSGINMPVSGLVVGIRGREVSSIY